MTTVSALFGSEPSQLPAHDVGVLPAVALGARLADTDDGDEAGTTRRERLGAHHGVGLAVIPRGARNGRQ